MTDVKVWLKGLGAAALGGAWSAVAGLTFGSIHDPVVLAKIAGAGALTHIVAYLTKSPIFPSSK